MTFIPYSIHNIASATGGFTIWHYRTKDTIKDILAPAYFNTGGSDILRRGDIVICDTGAEPIFIFISEHTLADGGNIVAKSLFGKPVAATASQPKPQEKKNVGRPKRSK